MGLAPVFVTDHNTIAGAFELRRTMLSLPLVVGEEIATASG